MAAPVVGGGLLLGALRWHQRQLTTFPITTNSVQGALLMAVGDSVAQRLERVSGGGGERRHDWRRTAVMASWSLCLSGPFWVRYYGWLARALPGRELLWVCITAGISIPFNAAFFSYTALCNHTAVGVAHPLATPLARTRLLLDVKESVSAKLWPTVAASTCFWPAVNACMFKFCPLMYRPLFASSCAIAWNIYLSSTNARTVEKSSAGVGGVIGAEV